jgi:hypothetical protein
MRDEQRAWIVENWILLESQTEVAKLLGLNSSTPVCIAIREFCKKYADIDPLRYAIYGERRRLLAECALYVFKRKGGIPSMEDDTKLEFYEQGILKTFEVRDYWKARTEHAFLLRMEGMRFREIGQRLGSSSAGANRLFHQYADRMRRAIRKTRWYWSKLEGADNDKTHTV